MSVYMYEQQGNGGIPPSPLASMSDLANLKERSCGIRHPDIAQHLNALSDTILASLQNLNSLQASTPLKKPLCRFIS